MTKTSVTPYSPRQALPAVPPSFTNRPIRRDRLAGWSLSVVLVASWILILASAPSSPAGAQEYPGDGMAQLSYQLESIAEALSASLTDEQFGRFIAQRIKAAPKLNAVALEELVTATARQGPESSINGLFTLGARVQDAQSMMKRAGMSIPRIDVLLPDPRYRESLQTVYVAVDPLVDESTVKSITAFTNGKRIQLDAYAPPKVPTFVIGLAERESLEPSYPLPASERPSEEENQDRIVDDFVGIPLIRISNDHEPWYRGNPEIVVRYRRFLQDSGVFQDLRKRLPSVNDTNKWYSLGDPNDTYLFFDDRWATSYELIVWEEDSPDSDDVVGVFIVKWRDLPFGGYNERSNRDARIRLDRD